jgi:hypothetical protein
MFETITILIILIIKQAETPIMFRQQIKDGGKIAPK